MLIDSHFHIDAGVSDDAVDALLERAHGAGVGGFVCVGIGGLDAARQALALARRRIDVVATAGIHPHDANTWDERLEAELVILLDDARVAAVGEVGLDYHYDHSPREVQLDVFCRFVAIARQVKKPLVVHTRSASADTLRVLREERANEVGGIIHCFSEDKEFARAALDLGFDLSFSGIVTFPNAQRVQEVAAWAPDDRILVETDSPYLAPVPVRGRRCEPAYVVHTARRLAELRGAPFEQIVELTSQNARRRLPALSASPGNAR
jgi:TatD DNase family protein